MILSYKVLECSKSENIALIFKNINKNIGFKNTTETVDST